MTDRFIVAEVSKNWQDGLELHDTGPIASQFEMVVNRNAERGYRLVTFSLHRLITGPGAMNETIIAVFEREAIYRLDDLHQEVLAQARGMHRDGATHDCGQWMIDGRCAICDKVL